MKIKTEDLVGAPLDWAAGAAEGRLLELVDGRVMAWVPDPLTDEPEVLKPYRPSTDWGQGGPILERGEIGTRRNVPSSAGRGWEATPSPTAKGAGMRYGYGPTPLIAGLRVHVAARLGDEVEVPDALLA